MCKGEYGTYSRRAEDYGRAGRVQVTKHGVMSCIRIVHNRAPAVGELRSEAYKQFLTSVPAGFPDGR
jgi:hypothetical protein